MTDFRAMPETDDDRYRIVDEPAAGALTRFAVNPFFPFLLVMLLGPLGFLAFIANSVALNGPKLKREIMICIAAIISVWFVKTELIRMLDTGALSVTWAPYLGALLTALRLAFGYFVFVSQAETHELRKYLRSLQERR